MHSPARAGFLDIDAVTDEPTGFIDLGATPTASTAAPLLTDLAGF
jgi:hypothetical protein